MLGRIAQRIVGRLPGAQLEAREQPDQGAASSQPGGTRQTGCFVPAASGLTALAILAGQMVEDHRLADIRAADDGHDQGRW